MANFDQILAELQQSLEIVGVPALIEPGDSMTAALSHAIGPFSLTDILENPTNLVGAGGIPSLAGDFPVTSLSQRIPEVEIKWSVKKDGEELEPDIDYLAPGGLDQLTLNLAFLPIFKPMEVDPPAPVTVEISASIIIRFKKFPAPTMGSPDEASKAFEVGPAKLILPTIAYPRVLALTKDHNFGGPAVILVPRDSYINSPKTLQTVLDPIRRILSAVRRVALMANMLTGIDALSNILNSTRVEFRRGDISDLNDIDLIDGTVNDIEAEDELSAFVYLSPPGSERVPNAVEMFIHTNFKGGTLKVQTGLSLVALCQSLEGPNPAIIPSTGIMGVDPVISFPRTASDFGNELSSIRFI